MHISLRLSWHNSGWNGHICDNPDRNTYCIGRFSYPGEQIRKQRKLAWEMEASIKGMPCGKLRVMGSPACACSINAFGDQDMEAIIPAPKWFEPRPNPALISIPPYTACTWNYEGMYGDDVRNAPGAAQQYKNDQRLQNARDYFDQLQAGKSLVFYYANYSNPFTEDDKRQYVMIGVSRIKSIGGIQFYRDVSPEVKRKYAGGFVWQMPITSMYPEEGFKIPYERYSDKPEILTRIVTRPDNPRICKFATRQVTEDDALALVEKFVEVANVLIEIGDTSQDWEARRNWLLSLISELWKQRGAYPGLPSVLEHLDFNEGIEYYKRQAENGRSKEALSELKAYLDGTYGQLQGVTVSKSRQDEITRNWQLQEQINQKMLLDVLPRFALTTRQVKNVVHADRARNSLYVPLDEITENPYLIAENYVGDDIDDAIPFSTIDHGILPSPDLGLDRVFAKNSKQRLRALCVETLRRETTHSFVSQIQILSHVNSRLDHMPDWKNQQFTARYFVDDAAFIAKAIECRQHASETYCYLQEVYEDERLVESVIREMQKRPDISAVVQLTSDDFYNFLKNPNSDVAKNAPAEYDVALRSQSELCERLFVKPVSVVSGAAGTGKTTLLTAIIGGIEKAHGIGTNFVLLAPTGKAAEKIREKTKRAAATIHSFLASKGWLNDNYSFKRQGGNVNNNVTTLIIDECSMINIALFATLFRSINWNSVQRLILVGDPNQLPPIGRGKAFWETIAWMKINCSENLGSLTVNVRQLENTAGCAGTGILDLAEIFIQEKQSEAAAEYDKSRQEDILRKIQRGSEIDKDLKVRYWTDMYDLEAMLKEEVLSDLQKDVGSAAYPGREHELWFKATGLQRNAHNSGYLQILSPFRGEYYGTEYLNTVFQNVLNGVSASMHQLKGISISDKVIQFRNRPKSNKISAYDVKAKKDVKIELNNGEIGFVAPHFLDKTNVLNTNFRLERLQVEYDGRDICLVNYGYIINQSDAVMFNEPVEENIELAYALSVHKAQGSEFERVYLILPRHNSRLLSMELIYTAITRSKRHLTIFIQQDITTVAELCQVGRSSIARINSSVFDFLPIPDEVFELTGAWYEAGKSVSTLSKYFVRSKSEMNIANILHLAGIPFTYETPLIAGDDSMYLPDFTLSYKGEVFYWEHVGRLDLPDYRQHWETKKKWYDTNFPGRLIVSYESNLQSATIKQTLHDKFGTSL